MPDNEDPAVCTFTRRSALKRLAVGGAGALVLGGTAAGQPGNSGQQGTCDHIVPDDHGTIQAAVDAADPGDTICVRDGTYTEQVVVDKSLTLQSADGSTPTIEPPASPDSFTIAESGPTWEPMVFAYGGTNQGGDVSGAETVTVSVSGFRLDGKGTQPDARRKPAVLLRNASGTVAENTIENLGVGGKETFGILAYGDSDVDVLGNGVADYERGGIGANGDGGAHPAPTVRIRDNTVEGSGGLGAAWGPNGIQVGFGAEGAVTNNDVLDNRYSDEGPVAAGILVFESDGVNVHHNRVENADIGLSCGSWGWLQQSADGNTFTKNQVVDSEFGALVESVAEPYGGVLTQTNPSASNNKIVNNGLEFESDQADTTGTDTSGNVGVGVIVDDNVDNDYDPVAENNKVVRNTISGYETATEDEGTDTKVRPFDP